MKIIELDAHFIKLVKDAKGTEFHYVDEIKEADGIMFLCPLCYQKNGNSNEGVHSVICWQPHIPQSISPKPGRWNFFGTGLNDLELKAGSSSIKLNGGCNAHFFIRNSEIQW